MYDFIFSLSFQTNCKLINLKATKGVHIFHLLSFFLYFDVKKTNIKGSCPLIFLPDTENKIFQCLLHLFIFLGSLGATDKQVLK